MSGIIGGAGSRSGVIGLISQNIAMESGKGIDFGASSHSVPSSEVLVDYEEGTWTPSLPEFAHGTSSTYGWYTKVGNLVHASFSIRRNSGTDASQVKIDGLPFNSHDSGTHTDGALITNVSGTSDLYRLQCEEGTNNCYGYTANGGDFTYNDHGGGEMFSGIIIYRSEPA